MKHPLLILITLFTAATAFAERPNIVLILADDLGYGDCGTHNPQCKIPTPHLDQLAAEGLRLTDAHAASVTCTPSRYGLLTGVNPMRTGVLNTLLARGKPVIDPSETTIATLLKEQGYATRMVGKWHLGFEMNMKNERKSLDFSKPLAGGPLDHGFDAFYGIHASPGSSPLFFIRDRSPVQLPTEKATVPKVRGEKTTQVRVTKAPGYLPEEASPSFCRETVQIIHDHAASENPKPLFLYYASPIPHQPWVPAAAFQGKSKLGDYGDFVMQLDDVVGQINSALKETGLDKNTLLIFTSDNGPGPWAVQAMAPHGHDAAGGLRGQKANNWEGGHRVPFIAKWPGHIPAASTSEAIINGTDLFATLAELVGVDHTKQYPGSAADSVSFLAALRDPGAPHTRPAMITRFSLREGDWKLVAPRKPSSATRITPGHFELYNLADDLGEQHEQSSRHPEQAQRLFQAFQTFYNHRTPK